MNTRPWPLTRRRPWWFVVRITLGTWIYRLASRVEGDYRVVTESNGEHVKARMVPSSWPHVHWGEWS